MHDHVLKPVIEKLQHQGATDEDIAKLIADLTQAATVALYKEALDTFSDDDMQQIEDAPDEKAANELIVAIYSQRVGTSAEDLLNVFLKEFVKKFLEEQQ